MFRDARQRSRQHVDRERVGTETFIVHLLDDFGHPLRRRKSWEESFGADGGVCRWEGRKGQPDKMFSPTVRVCESSDSTLTRVVRS